MAAWKMTSSTALNDLLNSKGGIEADPEKLATKLQEIRQQRAQAEAHISELQRRIEKLQNTGAGRGNHGVRLCAEVTTSILARTAVPSAPAGAVRRGSSNSRVPWSLATRGLG